MKENSRLENFKEVTNNAADKISFDSLGKDGVRQELKMACIEILFVSPTKDVKQYKIHIFTKSTYFMFRDSRGFEYLVN